MCLSFFSIHFMVNGLQPIRLRIGDFATPEQWAMDIEQHILFYKIHNTLYKSRPLEYQTHGGYIKVWEYVQGY